MKNTSSDLEENGDICVDDSLSMINENEMEKISLEDNDQNLISTSPGDIIEIVDLDVKSTNEIDIDTIEELDKEPASQDAENEASNHSHRSKHSRQSSRRHRSSNSHQQGELESVHVSHSRRASRVSQQSPGKSSRRSSMTSTNLNRSPRRESRYSVDHRASMNRRQSRLNSVRGGYNARDSLIPDESQIDLLNEEESILKKPNKTVMYMSPGLSRAYKRPGGEILISSFIIMIGLAFFVVYFSTWTRVWLITGGVCTGVGLLYLTLGICWVFSTTKVDIPSNSRVNLDLTNNISPQSEGRRKSIHV